MIKTKNAGLKRIPDVDLSECSKCGICIDLCPDTFRANDAGYVEVVFSSTDSEADIEEAIKNCRSNCISWKEPE